MDIKQAWQVLWNGLPVDEPQPEPVPPQPEIRYIIGDPVTVYAATANQGNPETLFLWGNYPDKILSYHLTCAGAFAAGGEKVESKKAYLVNGEYFLISQAHRIEVAPKPKKAKEPAG